MANLLFLTGLCLCKLQHENRAFTG